MSRADKFFAATRENPRDWRIAEIERLYDAEGVACRPAGNGSHYTLSHPAMNDILTIPAPADRAGLHSGAGAVHRWGSGDWCMNPRDYELDIRPLSAEDGGGLMAVAPELSGCRPDGETPEEALRNGHDAIACWIEAALENGRHVPAPRRAAA